MPESVPDILPRPPVVALLRRLLEEAEAGRIQSIAIAIAGPEVQLGHLHQYAYSGDPLELNTIRAQLGALTWLIDERGGKAGPAIPRQR